jgi:hypothetical protein
MQKPINGQSIWLTLKKERSTSSPVIGQFTANRGEFYNQDTYKGRAIFVRYVWRNVWPKSARMEIQLTSQVFPPSADHDCSRTGATPSLNIP